MVSRADDPVLRLEDIEDRNARTLNVTTRCNQRCTYCAGFSFAPLSDEEIDARLTGGRELILQGGEPTLHPRLLEYVARAKARGCGTVTLVTNGLRLAYPEFARACVAAGVDKFLVSLPSHRPEVCAALTRVERSFALKLAALRNLERLGVRGDVRLMHVLVAQNAPDLAGFARFLADDLAFVDAFELNLVQCFANVEHNWQVMPSFTELRGPLEEALALGERRGPRPIVSGIPPCMYPAHRRCASSHEARRTGHARITGLEFLPGCASCPLLDSCLGVRTEYLKIFGASEVEAARAALDGSPGERFPLPPPRRSPVARRLELEPGAAYEALLEAVRGARTDAALAALRAVLRVHGSEPAADQLAPPSRLHEAPAADGAAPVAAVARSGPHRVSSRPTLVFTDAFTVELDGELRDGSLYYRDFAIPVRGPPELRGAQRLFAQDIGRLLARGDRLTLTAQELQISDVDRIVGYLRLEEPHACRLLVPGTTLPGRTRAG